MTELLVTIFKTAISFPTVVLTVPLALALLYQIFSIATGVSGEVDGAVEGAMEGMFEGVAEGALEGVAEGAIEGIAEGAIEGVAEGAIEGIAEGAIEGVAEGAIEGVAEGALEGVAEGAVEGVAEGMAEGVAEGATEGMLEGAAHGAGHHAVAAAAGRHGLAKLFGCLGITSVPATLFLTTFFFFAWSTSVALTNVVGGIAAGVLIGGGILIAAFIGGLAMTAVMVRPLKPLFKPPDLPKRRDYIGKVVTIRTGKVDAEFGQAEFEDGEAGLLFDVRCSRPNTLKRGDKALIALYDRGQDVYYVAPGKVPEVERSESDSCESDFDSGKGS